MRVLFAIALVVSIGSCGGGSDGSGESPCDGQSDVLVNNLSAYDMRLWFDDEDYNNLSIARSIPNNGSGGPYPLPTGSHQAHAFLLGTVGGCQGDWSGTNGTYEFDLGCSRVTLTCD